MLGLVPRGQPGSEILANQSERRIFKCRPIREPFFFIFEAVRQAKCNACLPFKNERIKNGDEPPR